MRTFLPSVKCGLTIMGSSPLNDMDISRISFKSSYSRAVAWKLCLISVRYLPCMDGIPRGTKLCQQPDDWVKGYTMMPGSKVTQCTSKLFASTPYIMGAGGGLMSGRIFHFLGGGGGGV